MTTPGQTPPPNVFTPDVHPNRYGQELTDGMIREIGKGGVINSFEEGELELDNNVKLPIQALISDVELLEGVPAYGAAYMSANTYSISNAPILPFSTQIGPNKFVDIAPDGPGSLTYGELRGYDPGLWVVSFCTRCEPTAYTGDPWAGVGLHIDIYDSPTTILFSYFLWTVQPAGGADETVANTYSFVVPDSVDHFDVWADCASGQWRRWSGGTSYSMMSLRRISTDVEFADGPDPTVPDGNDPP